MDFFTADTHLGHANIIKYCSRPFTHVDVMNKTIIQNWNKIVSPTDTVYHLGDFGFGSRDWLDSIADALNGKRFILKGNHDRTVPRGFQLLSPIYEFKAFDEEMDEMQTIVLCHYPLQSWNKAYHGSWHLHGHCHGTLSSPDNMARLDVGVDTNGFTPISYDTIKEIMTKKALNRASSNSAR